MKHLCPTPAFRINHWIGGVSLSLENHYAVVATHLWEKKPLCCRAFFLSKVVLAYPFPIYSGNISSSLLILEVPLRYFKYPFGERVQPSGRKWKMGLSHFSTCLSRQSWAQNTASHHLQLEVMKTEPSVTDVSIEKIKEKIQVNASFSLFFSTPVLLWA